MADPNVAIEAVKVVHAGLTFQEVALYAFVALCGSTATSIGAALWKRISKRDCSDCASVNALHEALKDIKRTTMLLVKYSVNIPDAVKDKIMKEMVE